MSEDEGVLDRKTIIVDPEGLLMGMQMGSPDPERVNIHNVALARKLKEWLEAAGATCHITTEKDLFPTVIDRVLFSSEKKGDYFITVRHKERKCGVGYYFNSEPGKMLARSLRDSVSQTLGIPECRVSESSEFTIVQTEMPSVLITLPLYSLPEGRESNEAVLKETVALYQGMVQFFRGLK
jgi:N-acetylmuramoyl-L-alanine amidase